jgi:hypothetical protein
MKKFLILILVIAMCGFAIKHFIPNGEVVQTSHSKTATNLLKFNKTKTKSYLSKITQIKTRPNNSYISGYNREKLFGGTWKNNSYSFGFPKEMKKCNTRYATLVLQATKIKWNKYTCFIISGTWFSPYTNKKITNKSKIDIDHFVPLSNAYQSGANKWSSQKRIRYANSPNVLLISDSSSNRKKSDSSPDKWMPEKNKCGYLVKWIKIKILYKLSATFSEKNYISSFLYKYCL